MGKAIKHETEREFQVALGRAIRVMRKQRKMGGPALAKELGITHHAIYAWERGTFAPKLSHLWLISVKLGIPLSRIVAAAEKAMELKAVFDRDKAANAAKEDNDE